MKMMIMPLWIIRDECVFVWVIFISSWYSCRLGGCGWGCESVGLLMIFLLVKREEHKKYLCWLQWRRRHTTTTKKDERTKINENKTYNIHVCALIESHIYIYERDRMMMIWVSNSNLRREYNFFKWERERDRENQMKGKHIHKITLFFF